MVVVVGPPQPDLVLPRLLHLCRAIPPLPEVPLRGKEQVTRPIAPQVMDRPVHKLVQNRKALPVVTELARPAAEKLKVLDSKKSPERIRLRDFKTNMPMPLNHPEFLLPLLEGTGGTERRKRLAADRLTRNLPRRKKVGHRFRLDANAGHRIFIQDHRREHRPMVDVALPRARQRRVIE